MTATARPATCSALHAALVIANAPDADALSQVGCKRLPRHKGEHRTTLHLAAKPSASVKAPKGRVSRKGLKALQVKLAASIEDGSVKPSDALAKISAYVTKMAARKSRKVA